jgi:hypothetical protein
MEEGLSNTPPEDICYYYDQLTSAADRKDYLKYLLSRIEEDLAPGSFTLQSRYVSQPGTPDIIPTWAGIYTLWVHYSRATLPALSPILETYTDNSVSVSMTVADTIKGMVYKILKAQRDANELELDTPIYSLSKYLKVNPFIIQRWVSLSKNCPPSLVVAIHQTGRAKKSVLATAHQVSPKEFVD